ncbi:hypothetical protein Bca101_090026 [Brassica carinata]
MLGTTSPWVGQSLVVFNVVFLVVGLSLIVTARLGFQDLVFADLTFTCVELVSWSFGLFYSELCDSSLAMSVLYVVVCL